SRTPSVLVQFRRSPGITPGGAGLVPRSLRVGCERHPDSGGRVVVRCIVHYRWIYRWRFAMNGSFPGGGFPGHDFGGSGGPSGGSGANDLWNTLGQLRQSLEDTFGQTLGQTFGQAFGQKVGTRVGRGDVRAAILSLLSEQPMHGYQIIQQIEERSG